MRQTRIKESLQMLLNISLLGYGTKLIVRCCAIVGRGEVRAGFWWGNLRERDHLEDLSVDGRNILKFIFN